MPDNIAITQGTGTTIATDDVAGTHYQRVKLVDGALEGTAGIPGDATNGLDVDVTRVQGTVTVTATDLDVRNLASATDSVSIGTALPAGTNNIGDVDVLSLPTGTVAGSASLPAGTNNIGDVDVLSLPAATVAGSASLPAGTNNIGDVDLASAIPTGTNKIGSVSTEITPTSGGTALVEGFASIDTATSGDNTIVGAVVGRRIRVLSIALVCTGAVSVRWKSGATTNRSGPMAFAANGGYSAHSSFGLLETVAGEALVLNVSAAVQVSGHVAYVEV